MISSLLWTLHPHSSILSTKQTATELAMADDISTWDAAGVVARAKALIHSSNVRIHLFPFVSSAFARVL